MSKELAKERSDTLESDLRAEEKLDGLEDISDIELDAPVGPVS